jgi:hypothetical protein
MLLVFVCINYASWMDRAKKIGEDSVFMKLFITETRKKYSFTEKQTKKCKISIITLRM